MLQLALKSLFSLIKIEFDLIPVECGDIIGDLFSKEKGMNQETT